MIKKIRLLFFYLCCSVSLPCQAESIFIDPTVAIDLIEEYFSDLISSQRLPELMQAYPSDKQVYSQALAEWLQCLSQSSRWTTQTQTPFFSWSKGFDPYADNLISPECAASMCLKIFTPIINDQNRNKVVPFAQVHCNSFFVDLITTPQPETLQSNCRYNISKHNNQQSQIKFVRDDGTGFIRKGGHLPWRFFNPGNLRRSALACAVFDTSPNGRFAVFDSYEKGRLALLTLLRGERYGSLTIEQAINTYAPPIENNTTSYIRYVKQSLSANRDDVDAVKLWELSDEELGVVMDAIERIEGWTEQGIGTIETI